MAMREMVDGPCAAYQKPMEHPTIPMMKNDGEISAMANMVTDPSMVRSMERR